MGQKTKTLVCIIVPPTYHLYSVISGFTRVHFFFIFYLNTVTLTDGSAAPGNSRPPARPPPERPARLAKKPRPISSPSSSPLFQSRPTKRLESGAVLREKKRAAAHRSSPACPGATPTSGSGEPAHTIEKIDPNPSSSRARCDLINIHMSAVGGKTLIRPFFFFFNQRRHLHPLKHFLAGGPEREARAARTARLLPSPATLFPGVRCRQDPLTPSTALPPPARQNPSILTDDLIRPAPDRACSPPCRPPYPFFFANLDYDYYFLPFFSLLFSSSGVHSQALPAQP